MTVTLITGANKGLGFESARQLLEHGHVVYLGARDAGRGEAAARALATPFVQLDVTDDASVTSAMAVIAQREGRLDVLVNNAGVSATGDVDSGVARQVYDTNVIGIIRVTEAALPLLQRSANPVVVNVSSALGSFWAVTTPERRQFHFPSIIYGSSKAAVSMLTVQYAKAMPGIKFNAVEPGFTATDLTPFSGAGQPVEVGAKVIVRMATIGADGPTGTFAEGDEPATGTGDRDDLPCRRTDFVCDPGGELLEGALADRWRGLDVLARHQHDDAPGPRRRALAADLDAWSTRARRECPRRRRPRVVRT